MMSPLYTRIIPILLASSSPFTWSQEVDTIDWFADTENILNFALDVGNVVGFAGADLEASLEEEESVPPLLAKNAPTLRKEMVDELVESSLFHVRHAFEQALTQAHARTAALSARFEVRGSADRLRAMKDVILTEIIDDWKESESKRLAKMSVDEARNSAQGNQHFFNQSEGQEWREKGLKRWQEALKTVFDEETLAQLEKDQESLKARRCRALTDCLLAALEPHLQLTPVQHEAMMTLAVEILPKELPDYFFDPGDPQRGYHSLNLYQIKSELPESKLKDVFDDEQREFWKAIPSDYLQQDRRYIRLTYKLPEDWPESDPVTKVDAQRVITFLIRRCYDQAVQQGLDEMASEVAQLCGAVDLPEDVQAQLNTLAKKVAVSMATERFESVESSLYSRFRSYTNPEDLMTYVKQRGGGSSGYGYSRKGIPEQWTRTVDKLLTESQKAQWEAAKQALDARKHAVISELMLTEIEKSCYMEGEKKAALEARVLELLQEYGKAFNERFQPTWYLNGYYIMAPLGLLEEEELKVFFTETQREALEPDINRVRQNVQHLKQRQEQQNQRGGLFKGLLNIFR